MVVGDVYHFVHQIDIFISTVVRPARKIYLSFSGRFGTLNVRGKTPWMTRSFVIFIFLLNLDTSVNNPWTLPIAMVNTKYLLIVGATGTQVRGITTYSLFRSFLNRIYQKIVWF